MLGSVGQYEEAARLLTTGLDAFRGLDDGWFLAYGLAHLSAARAGQGDLDAALAASREAVALAEAPGLGYPLALARTNLLWQEEVRAPGHPDLARGLPRATERPACRRRRYTSLTRRTAP